MSSKKTKRLRRVQLLFCFVFVFNFKRAPEEIIIFVCFIIATAAVRVLCVLGVMSL